MSIDKEHFQGILAQIASNLDGTLPKKDFASASAKLHLHLLEDAGYVVTENHGEDVRVTAAGFAALNASATTQRNVFDIYMTRLTGVE